MTRAEPVVTIPDLFGDEQRHIPLFEGASLLGVYGIWQRQGEVRHLVARRLVDMSHLLGRLNTHSRDFC